MAGNTIPSTHQFQQQFQFSAPSSPTMHGLNGMHARSISTASSLNSGYLTPTASFSPNLTNASPYSDFLASPMLSQIDLNMMSINGGLPTTSSSSNDQYPVSYQPNMFQNSYPDLNAMSMKQTDPSVNSADFNLFNNHFSTMQSQFHQQQQQHQPPSRANSNSSFISHASHNTMFPHPIDTTGHHHSRQRSQTLNHLNASLPRLKLVKDLGADPHISSPLMLSPGSPLSSPSSPYSSRPRSWSDSSYMHNSPCTPTHPHSHSHIPSSLSSPVGLHACPEEGCLKTFETAEKLKVHGKCHRQTRRYMCETCKEMFFRRQDLLRHSARHSAVKMHACDVCGARFTRQDAKHRHMKMIKCAPNAMTASAAIAMGLVTPQ
jgi:hypothetical protein